MGYSFHNYDHHIISLPEKERNHFAGAKLIQRNFIMAASFRISSRLMFFAMNPPEGLSLLMFRISAA
jgi:hypothetical protein